MIYADASFLVSLYQPDSNSAAAARAMRAAKQHVLVTTLAELEVVNALRLRVFRKEASAAQVQTSLDNFQTDLRKGALQLRPLPEHVFDRARYLSAQTTARLGTGTADLLHVSAAVEIGAESLYSFDGRQRRLARSLGLGTN